MNKRFLLMAIMAILTIGAMNAQNSYCSQDVLLEDLAAYIDTMRTPDTAVKHLMTLIRRNDMLWDELQQMGYYSHSKTFSPRQVQAIFDWLGAPESP